MNTSVRQVLIALGAVFAWVIVWYHDTAAEILNIWWRSETFAHGLLVLPIFAWLVWRSGDRLVGKSVRPCWAMSLFIVFAGTMWLLGELSSVASVTHVALALLLIFSLIGVLGLDLARVLAFPILFLFFGVPIGEFLLPTMMKYTALFTVAAVRMSGVPVYQEGLHFVVPNGRWSVVEACSGVRYLIASLMVGTLYAYLSYRSLQRRLLFVACAVVVPIVANWLRAYMIVMLGYLSDNAIATGVDHILYGWLFFGIVIMLMFWIGGRWREDLAPGVAVPADSQSLSTEKLGGSALALRAAPLAVAVAVWPLFLDVLEQPGAAPLQSLPDTHVLRLTGGWEEVAAGPSVDFKPSFQGFQRQVLRHFTDGQNRVSVYVAVYAQQGNGRELVNTSNQLLQPSDENWSRVAEMRGPDWGSGSWLHSVLAGRGRSITVLSGYWIDGRLVTNDYVAKALLALIKLEGRPDTSAYVAVWASASDGRGADEQLEAFRRDNGRSLIDALVALDAPK